jgi:hypothetical protein
MHCGTRRSDGSGCFRNHQQQHYAELDGFDGWIRLHGFELYNYRRSVYCN